MKNIKKVLLVISLLFLTVGCGNMMNTPTKKVEEFLNKYQSLDSDVTKQLSDVLDDASFNDNQRDKYHELMKKQYKNLEYKIKDETIDGNNAIVEVEIQVLDYGKTISETETYLANNKDKFLNDNKEIDNSKYLDYKIEQLEKVKDKISYTINFDLTKEDGKWVLNDIDDIEVLKIHGLYY